MSEADLTTVETRIFYGLIEYPDHADNKVAKEIDASRQLVARSRKSFERERLLRTTNIPNIHKLGLEILRFSSLKFNTLVDPEKKEEGIRFLLKNTPVLFLVAGKFDGCGLFVFEDFEQYQECNTQLLRYFERSGLLAEKPVDMLFSIPNLEMLREHSYAPFIYRLFELDEQLG